MQFYFIRHAQSQNNLLWDTTGSNIGRTHDPELTEIGRRQAERVARFLATGPSRVRPDDPAASTGRRDYYNSNGFGITSIYTSLMVRAVATATIVAQELSLPAVACMDLHEVGGIYQGNEHEGERVGMSGNNRGFYQKNYPDLILPSTLGEEGWWNCRPYEERSEALVRAERFLSDLLARHGGTDDHVAVVSHAGFYNELLRAVFKISGENRWVGLNNTGVTRIDFEPEHVEWVYANRLDFLPADLVT